MATAVILSAGYLWYLLNLFSTFSLSCEEVMAWWFAGDRFHPDLLYVSSLFTVTLGLWLYVDIVRPKPVRIPAGIRWAQAVFVAVMVLMSVFQWGFYRPFSAEGRIYGYFQDEVVGWPGVRLFFIQGAMPLEMPFGLPEEVESGPFFETFRALDAAWRRDFQDPWVARNYGRQGGRMDGRLECTARREVDAAWELAYQAWLEAEWDAAEQAQAQ